MRKTYLLITCLMMGLCILTGCSASDDFTAGTYSHSADEIQNIVIDVQDRAVTVSPSEDGQVHIDYFHSPKEFYNITLDNGTLHMKYDENKNWTDFIGVKPSDNVRRIDVYVPEDALSSLSVDTTNETITVNSLTVSGSVRLKSNWGDVRFSGLDTKSLSMETKNGDIKGSVAGSYDDYTFSVNKKDKDKSNISSGGSGERRLSVRTNNGDVSISFLGN